MKKNIKFFLKFFTVIFTLIIGSNVYAAAAESYANKCVYNFTDNKNRQGIIYVYPSGDKVSSNLSLDNIEFAGGGHADSIVEKGEKLSRSSGIFIIEKGNLYCPDHAYFCYNKGDNHVTNSSSSCSGEYAKIDIDKGRTSGIGKIYKASEDSAGNIQTCKTNAPSSISSNVSSNIRRDISNKNYSGAYSRIKNVLSADFTGYCDSESIEKYVKEASDLKKEIDTAVSKDSSLSDEQKNNLAKNSSDINTIIQNINSAYSLSSFSVPTSDVVVGCNELIDEDLKQVIQLALRWIRIIAPIILIILVAVDFAQVVISNDKDATQKAVSKAIKRGIAALALFFIPLIVSIMIDWVNDSEYFNKSNADCSDILK